MTKAPNVQLLKNEKALEEIHRHLWIESEKVGYDIGFEKAANDWLEKFSKAWMEYHAPKKKAIAPKKRSAARV